MRVNEGVVMRVSSVILSILLVANSVLGVSAQVPTSREVPIASITFTVSEGAQDELIQQLMKFAEANRFKMRVGHIRDMRHFYMELWRDDINLSIANPFNDATLFSIGIYQTSKSTLPPGHIDSIINDLRDAIVNIPGVTINSIKQ
jgi:hypothetical protein